MNKESNLRRYNKSECCVFCKTREQFGGLSNMAAGYPIELFWPDGQHVPIFTSEALYQACRFPFHPDIQQAIISEKSPMSAKDIAKLNGADTRPDWDRIRVKVMRWCLHVKYVQNQGRFKSLLESTGDKPIVEYSWKDDFWGAKTVSYDELVGVNALGRLLMELRGRIKAGEDISYIDPPNIESFNMLDKKIEVIYKRSRLNGICSCSMI